MDDLTFLRIAGRALEFRRRMIAAEANINRMIAPAHRLPAQQAAIDEYESLRDAEDHARVWAARMAKERKHGPDSSRPTSRRVGSAGNSGGVGDGLGEAIPGAAGTSTEDADIHSQPRRGRRGPGYENKGPAVGRKAVREGR